VSAGYPAGDLGLKAELLLGDTWTDVTDYAMPDGATDVTITSGTADMSQDPTPTSASSAWDNPDGRFTRRNPTGPYYGLLGQNTPGRISVTAVDGTRLRADPDEAPGSCACPGGGALELTGDLDVRIDYDLTGYVYPDFAPVLAAKAPPSPGAELSWQLGLQDDGRAALTLGTTAGGAYAAVTAASTLPVPCGRLCLRAALDASAGTVTWYTGAPGAVAADGPWTQLGDVIALPGAVTLAADASWPLTAAPAMSGSVWRLQLAGSGAVVADADFTVPDAGSASFADSCSNTWTVAGAAEITDRDYRLHGQLASAALSTAASGGAPQAAVQLAGPLRPLQAGSAPAAGSPLRRAISALAGDSAPLAYWTGEDAAAASSFAARSPQTPPMTWVGSPQLAADSGFAGSDPVALLNGSSWLGLVPPQAPTGTVVTRFVCTFGTPPASGSAAICRIALAGTVSVLTLRYNSDGKPYLIAWNSDGSAAFASEEAVSPFATSWAGQRWLVSVELLPSGASHGLAQARFLRPDATTATDQGTVAGAPGPARVVRFGPERILTDTAIGHAHVQSALTDATTLLDPYAAWAGELGAPRFARVLDEEGIPCRVYGAPAVSAPMGPQPSATIAQILDDVQQTDLGVIYEPAEALAVGYRTHASLLGQAPLLLDLDDGDQPGAPQATDDDSALVNDWTATDPAGNSGRAVLDDGSPNSVGAVGRYQDTAQANCADPGDLVDVAGWLLRESAADEPRVPSLSADFGLPSLSAAQLAAISRLRPGDAVGVTSVPVTVGAADVLQLAIGATETLGPGRRIDWNCAAASPWDVMILDDPVLGRADTDGSSLAGAADSTATTLSVGTGAGYPVWTQAPADLPYDVAIEGEQVTFTAAGPGPVGCLVGVFLNPSALGVSTWAQAAAIWQGWTGVAPAVNRVYMGGSPWTISSDMTAMIAAGCKMLISVQPAYSPVSSTDYADLQTFCAALVTAGAQAEISIWPEPFFAGLTSAQYIAAVQYYAGAIRPSFPLAFVTAASAVLSNSENSWYPGDAYVDLVATDIYAAGYDAGATLALCAAPADAAVPPKPFGIWEINGSRASTGQTQAQVQAFFGYAQAYMAGRALNADVVLFNGAPGRSSLGAGTTAEAGFEGNSLGNWVNAGSASLAPTTAQAHSGGYSMALTATASGSVQGASCLAANFATQMLACSPGDTIDGAAWFRAATSARSCQVGIGFYTAAGTLVTSTYGSAVTDSATGWTTRVTASGITAPATSAWCRLLTEVLSAGAASEVHYVDDCELRNVTGANAENTTTIEFGWDYRVRLWQSLHAALNGTRPQSFTVTRSVNGVVKAHAAGADVRLWQPPALAKI
jgi:hypothetical protein